MPGTAAAAPSGMPRRWALFALFFAASAGSVSATKVTFHFADVLEASERASHRTVDVIHQLWWLGALATLAGATLTIVGLMLQKTAHAAGKGAEEPGLYCTSRRWLLGLLVWVVGQVVCWTADGLANRSLLACFNCWNIVVVFVLAPWCLGETVVREAALGAAITFGGCIWVVLTGPRDFRFQTVDTLKDSWLSPAFICLVAVSLLAGAWLAARTRWGRAPADLLPVHLAAFSAIFAWYAVLMSKCASTLTVTSVESKIQFGHWQFWAYLLAMVAFAVCQVHTLNMAMKAGTAIVVLPAYESLSMLGQVLLCGVFFDEFHGFGPNSFVLFSCAILSVLCGIGVMTSAGVIARDGSEAAAVC